MEKLKAFIVLLLPFLGAAFLSLSPNEVITNLSTGAGIVFLVPIIVEKLKVSFNLSGKIWLGIKASRILTWGLSIGLMMLSYFLKLGFVGFEPYTLVVLGFGIGMAANGYYTLEDIMILLAKYAGNTKKLEELKEKGVVV